MTPDASSPPTDPGPTILVEERCTGCGLCVGVCIYRRIEIRGGKARFLDLPCLECDHCAAVCPSDAIVIPALERGAPSFSTVEVPTRWLAPGESDPGELIRLMASRRSCRSYTDRPVPREVLEDLVNAGMSAPSGTNGQGWAFVIYPDRASVRRLGEQVAGFYERLNRLARNPLARAAARLFMGDELGRYYRDYYPLVEEGLREFREAGVDRLFHGAPAAIVVGSVGETYSPEEDALLATQNILLAAHAMGLGTCLIGFAVEAMVRARKVKAAAGIPEDHRVHAVIALGQCRERYRRTTRRKEARITYVT